MKKLIVSFIFGLFCIFPLASQSNSIIENEEFTSNIKVLELWIDAQMEYRELPGMSIGIVYDQELIYAKGFGYSNLEQKTSATPQTVYRIASITKTFTATALMQLRDEGKLSLDDPIKKYLPWFSIKNSFPDAPEITIRQLITHTSGLPREAAFPYWTDRNFPSLEEIATTLPNQEMIYASETEYKYSNLGLALAGEIVSVVSGMPYYEYIKENIFDPLKMKSSRVFLSEKEKGEIATPYTKRLSDGTREVMPFTDSKGLTPAANISSNVVDLSQYISLQFSNGEKEGIQILKGSTLREMHRVQWLHDSWTSGQGLGFRVWKQGDNTAVGHGGWVAGNRTQISFIPKEKVGVIVMTNSDDGSPNFFASRILSQFTPILSKAFDEEKPSPKFDPSWKKFVGTYIDPSYYETEILIFNNSLIMNGYSFPPEDNPASEIVVLYPEGKNTFRRSGENGNGELVVFELDENGKVVRVKTGENYIFPKK